MNRFFPVFILGLFFLSANMAFGYGYYTVFTTVPADVYVDNEYRATLSATQTLKLILSGPQTYIIGVRARANGQTYKESVTVGADLNEHREIHAFSTQQTSKSEITVYSTIPADVYVDNVLESAVDATHPMAIILPGTKSYMFEVRARESNLVYREEVSIDQNSAVRKEIRAFPETQVQVSQPSMTPPPSAAPYVTPVPLDVATPVSPPQGYISREEMTAEIKRAAAQAKAETLAEEAGRRKRAEKRAVTSKGIAHVVGVEANRSLPNSVKNMERIKLLLEGLPAFGK
jgi:hypothetical protein